MSYVAKLKKSMCGCMAVRLKFEVRIGPHVPALDVCHHNLCTTVKVDFDPIFTARLQWCTPDIPSKAILGALQGIIICDNMILFMTPVSKHLNQ